MVGGYSGYAGLSTVERYIPSEGIWQSAPSVTNPRGHGIMTAVINNDLYAIGGFYNSGICYNTNEMYDRSSDAWVSKAPMPIAMQAGVSAAWNDNVYIFGGEQSSGTLTTTMIYDTIANSWSYGADIPRERTFGRAVTFDDYIYLIGGARGSNIIDVYDPVNDLWSSTCNYPGANNCCPVIAQSDNLVYVLADLYTEPGATECWAGQIPEPATLLLFGLGCLALRRKHRAK